MQNFQKNIKNIIILIIASVIIKLSYLVFACCVFSNPSIISYQNYIGLNKRNDTGWYEKIATKWYPANKNNQETVPRYSPSSMYSAWAFFPFYPAMIRFFMKCFSTDFYTAGFFLALLFSALALTGFYFFCELLTNNPARSFYYSLIFLFFPFHYYYSMMYTEAVFFVFLIFSFIAIHKRKYIFIPFLIIPLVLVRLNGIITLIPLYLYYLERNDLIVNKHIRFSLLLSRKNIYGSLIFITGPLVFIAYCIYQKYMTGYYFAFSIAQADWHREFTSPFLSLFNSNDFTSLFNSFYAILFLILSFFAWKRYSLSLNIFIWMSIFMTLCSGSPLSIPRYISVIFPLTIMIADWFYSVKFRYLLIVVLYILQLWVFYYWIIGDMFSC